MSNTFMNNNSPELSNIEQLKLLRKLAHSLVSVVYPLFDMLNVYKKVNQLIHIFPSTEKEIYDIILY